MPADPPRSEDPRLVLGIDIGGTKLAVGLARPDGTIVAEARRSSDADDGPDAMIGRVISMVVVGLAIGIGLWLLGVPLALALGSIAFLLDFIPFIGPLVAAVPALLVAFAISPTLAASVALLYGGVQLVEGYVLTPLIEQRSVRLPPALTIAAQVFFGVVTGALGVLFATPLTAAAVTLVQKLYVEDALGDKKVPSRRRA